MLPSPLPELAAEALHLLLALACENFLLVQAPCIRRCFSSTEPLALQALALLKPLLVAALPHLQAVEIQSLDGIEI